MKLALLSFEYPPETGFGGIGTYTWHHARGLAKLGHEVHVLAGATKATPLHGRRQDGVVEYRHRSDGLLVQLLKPLAGPRLWWTKNRLENAISMYRGLKALRREHRYDLIEMPECGAEGGLINYLMREQTLIKFHSPARIIMPFYDVPKADVMLCSAVEQVGIRGAKAFTACSRFLSGEVRARLGITRPIEVIPNGIDLTWFDSQEQIDFRRKWKLPRDRPVILFAGRMERRKGVELCREIAASILERYPVAFVLAGQDLFRYVAETLLPALRSRPLRGSLHFLGKLDLTEVRSGLSQSDIFLLPSLWENCPYACLEAMAAGRAIVSTDQGGMPELIRDGENGLLARSGDAASFVQAVERLLEDPGLRERLGGAARRTIEQSFTAEYIAARSVAYYRRCLGETS